VRENTFCIISRGPQTISGDTAHRLTFKVIAMLLSLPECRTGGRWACPLQSSAFEAACPRPESDVARWTSPICLLLRLGQGRPNHLHASDNGMP